MLAPEDIVWRSDALGVLGTGGHVEVAAAQLPAGAQHLMVTVPAEQGPPLTQRVAVLRAPQQREITAACIGDCNLDGVVTVDELITGVSIALGSAPLSSCDAFDANGDGVITVDEILTAVSNALAPPSLLWTGVCGDDGTFAADH